MSKFTRYFINILFKLVFSTVLIFNSCESSDDKPINPDNLPPSEFNLITIPNNTSGLNLTGDTFSWEIPFDPDGDDSRITYTVYFGTDPNNIDIPVAFTLDAFFDFTGRFNTCTTYYWKVVATDADGGETESNSIFNFTTRDINVSTSAIADPAQFSKRFGHQVIVYDNRMWLIAGATKNGVTFNDIPYNDVYYSTDGVEWEQITQNADFSKRKGHASITFKNKMWVIGGEEDSGIFTQSKNDVWSSTDGWNWNLETANANFQEVSYHRCIVFDDKIWLFTDDDIWNSVDGVNWQIVSDNTTYGSRKWYTVNVFNDEMWLIGGYAGFEDFKNDIWKSKDGIIWTQVLANAPFDKRFLHATTVFDDKLFVIGGQDSQIIGSKNDVWFTKDGIGWSQKTSNAPFKPRALHTATSYNDKIWIIAGDKATGIASILGYNDVWTFD